MQLPKLSTKREPEVAGDPPVIIDDDVAVPKRGWQTAASNRRRASTERLAAKARGDKTFVSGKPCRRGHVGPRYVNGNQCVECTRAQTRAYRKANPKKTKETAKSNWLAATYGLTLEQHDAMLQAQGGACAICGVCVRRKSHVDHCHATGRIRGLLCPACNKGIGHLRDCPDILRKGAEYLEAHK